MRDTERWTQTGTETERWPHFSNKSWSIRLIFVFLYFINICLNWLLFVGERKNKSLCILTPFNTLTHHVLACQNNYK